MEKPISNIFKSLEERLPELKARMPEGPWQYEPDIFIYTDEYSGYRCEIRRSTLNGSLCGYVYVPSDHLFIAKRSADGRSLFDNPFEVHGGVTYFEKKPSSDSNTHIIGFDCAHLGDYSPIWGSDEWGSIYRSFSYVKSEVDSLAKQLFEYEKKGNL